MLKHVIVWFSELLYLRKLIAKLLVVSVEISIHPLILLRSRVPQMASTVSQRRSGTVLPPPADDFSYSAVVSAKHTIDRKSVV